jgi:hypothetical protein
LSWARAVVEVSAGAQSSSAAVSSVRVLFFIVVFTPEMFASVGRRGRPRTPHASSTFSG